MNEVNANTSLLTLLVLSFALVSGCTVSTGSCPRTIRLADEQGYVSSERKVRQLQEELRLAEKRADLEKQKREAAEERLKKFREKTAEPTEPEIKSDHGS